MSENTETTNGIIAAREVRPGDVLTIPHVGMVIVRDVKQLNVSDDDTQRVSHVTIRVAVGRTDEGFDLTYPGFVDMDVYRSEGFVEAIGG